MKGKSRLATHTGGRIRVNRHVPVKPVKIGKSRISLRARLRRHERVEKKRMDAGLHYKKAHKMALKAEHKGLTKKQIQQYEGKLGSIARWKPPRRLMD